MIVRALQSFFEFDRIMTVEDLFIAIFIEELVLIEGSEFLIAFSFIIIHEIDMAKLGS